MVASGEPTRYRDEEDAADGNDGVDSPNGAASNGWADGSARHARDHGALKRLARLDIAAAVRAVFNYPGPDLDLGSTAWLDGLRGLAALEIVVAHYCDGWVDNRLAWGTETNEYTDSSWWLLPFLRTLYASGDACVPLFFIISGYALSTRLLQLLRQKRLTEFYASLASATFRRPFRLYLPVAIETFILMFVCRVFGLPKPVPYLPAENLLLEIKGWWVSFVHLFIPLKWPAIWYMFLDRYDGHVSWVIPLEFSGSLVTFLVLLGISRFTTMKVRQWALAVVTLHTIAKDDWISAAFLLGIIFADWQLRSEEQADGQERQSSKSKGSRPFRTWKKSRSILFPALFFFGFFLAGMPPGHFRNDYEGDKNIYSRPFFNWISQPLVYCGIYADRQADWYILTVAGISTVIGTAKTPLLRHLTMSRPIQYLGSISFGLYLGHIFLRAWLRPLDYFYLGLAGLTPDDLQPDQRRASFKLFFAFMLHMIVALPVNLVVGGLLERFLDRPSVLLAKRLDLWCVAKRQKRILLPTASGQATEPSLALQDTAIAMVDMVGARHADDSPDGAGLTIVNLHRPSLPPPAEFEDDMPSSHMDRSPKVGDDVV